MGCGASSAAPGGAYPGNRRPVNQPYSPPPSQFSNGQATTHFVSYGGGNALVRKQNGVAQPEVGARTEPELIQVTLPENVYAGQTIQVAAPDGRLNEITIPEGFGPGSSFTVEFADPTTKSNQPFHYDTRPAAMSVSQMPCERHYTDDGFATGFNNPGFVPQATATTHVVPESNYSALPQATDAQPVFSKPLAPYVSKPY